MKLSTKFAGALTALCLTAGMSSAATLTLDFTDIDNFGSNQSGEENPITGNFNGVQWTLAALPKSRNLTFGNADNPLSPGDRADCQAKSGLECDFDGVGITPNDELSGAQIFVLSFDKAYSVNGVSFLDLFIGTAPDKGAEGARFEFDGTEKGKATANSILGQGSGYVSADFAGDFVQRISFFTTGERDDNDIDFALASVSFFSSDGNTPDAIPLPAGGLLLLGALGGLGLMRRRKTA